MDGKNDSFIDVVCSRKLGLKGQASLTTTATCGTDDLSLKNKTLGEVKGEIPSDNKFCDTRGLDFSENYY
jgi:hypothetical protein